LTAATTNPRVIGIFAGESRATAAPHQLMPAIWLASRGVPIRCLIGGDGPKGVANTPLGSLELEPVGRLGAMGQLRICLRVLRRRIAGKGGEVFYVHGSPVCPGAWLGLAGVRRSRVIYHTQDFLEPGRHSQWEFFERRVARRASRVICNEPNRARFMASHYGLGEMPAVVPTALPRAWPVPDRDAEVRRAILRHIKCEERPSATLLFHAGPFSPVRCTVELFRAVATLPPNVALVMTGNTPGSEEYERGRAAAADAGIADRVVFLPRLGFDDLLRHGAACDVGILLYPNDGLGNFFQAPGRLSEYLRCGLPVVASAFPGLELLVAAYDIGATCEPSSPSSISSAVAQLAARPEERWEAERRRLIALALGDLAFDAGAHVLEDIVVSALSDGFR
jgi:glycosyltransferase involved in cell wall biosynthesis